MTTKSYQRLALTSALLTASSPIILLDNHVLQLIAKIHANPSTTPSKGGVDRFKSEQAKTTDSLPSNLLNQARPCPANGATKRSQSHSKRFKLE